MFERILDLVDRDLVDAPPNQGSGLHDSFAGTGQGDPLWDVSAEDVLDLLRETSLLINRASAIRTQLSKKLADSGIWAELGYRSPESFLHDQLNVDSKDTKKELRKAERLGHMPHLAKAFLEGHVDSASVDQILSVGFKSRERARELPHYDEIFTSLACDGTSTQLKQVLALWSDQVDPVGTIEDEQASHNKRFLRLAMLPDGCHIDGFLTHNQGAKIAAVLNGIMEQRYQAKLRQESKACNGKDARYGQTIGGLSACETGECEAGECAAGKCETGECEAGACEAGACEAGACEHDQDPLWDSKQSHTSQERADALVQLVDSFASIEELPSCRGITPTVLLTVPIDRVQGNPRVGRKPSVSRMQDIDLRERSASHSQLDETKDELAISPTRIGTSAERAIGNPSSGKATDRSSIGRLPLDDDVCEISVSNGPGRAIISAITARQMMCDSMVNRVVVNERGLPLDVGRSTRSIPSGIRKALIVRDKGCIHPHCDRPSAWCDGHHVQHWADGGPTSLDNLVLLCEMHHMETHNYNHEIEFDQTGFPRMKPNYFYNAERERIRLE